MMGVRPPSSMHRTIRNDQRYRGTAADNMDKILNSCVPFSEKPNAQYGPDEFQSVMMGAAALGSTVYGYAESVRRRKTTSLGLGKRHRMAPSGEWATNICQQIKPEALTESFGKAVASNVKRMQELGLLSGDVDIAIDMHLERHWHKKHGADLIGSKSNGRTGLFARYITAQVAGTGEQLILGAAHMPALEETSEYVRMMVSDCRKAGIKVGTVMLDRGFISVDVIRTLEELGVGYLMPCINRSRVVDAINEFAEKKRASVSRFRMTKSDGTYAEFDMIITRRKRRKKKDSNLPEERYIAFATNRPWVDVERYARRWIIETGYRMVKNMQVKTRSRNHVYRTFCFLYSLATFNAWVLVNAENIWQQRMASWTYYRLTQTDMKVIMLWWFFSGEWNWKGPPDSTHSCRCCQTCCDPEKVQQLPP